MSLLEEESPCILPPTPIVIKLQIGEDLLSFWLRIYSVHLGIDTLRMLFQY